MGEELDRKRKKVVLNEVSSPSLSRVHRGYEATSIYEVFLSFSGEDTRKSFTDHLYTSLCDAGISTFRDSERLHTGEHIGMELLNAIRRSKISIPIFSKNYASSEWCLLELTEMVKCMKCIGQVIFPIFYNVTPSNVRHQTDEFGKAFLEHEKKFVNEIILEWKGVLKEVAMLKGWEKEKIANGHEAQLIKEIVSKICILSGKNHVDIPENLIGMDIHVEQMTRLLNVGKYEEMSDEDIAVTDADEVQKILNVNKDEIVSGEDEVMTDENGAMTILNVDTDEERFSDVDKDEETKIVNAADSEDVRIIGIHGMGGIGKTTISKFIYNQLAQHFKEGCSFLANVREQAARHNGLVNLQNQLLCDILHTNNHAIKTVGEGEIRIRKLLHKKKVLIVLDDVVERWQLLAVARNYYFGPGSRVIVTTRNRFVLSGDEIYGIYEPEEMNFDHSLQLFSKHAFERNIPPEDFGDISRDIVSRGGGLPLYFEVVGSFLFGKKHKAFWEDTLEKLKRIPNDKVQAKLKLSYDSLDDLQRKIFLDIACHFIGENKRYCFYMWTDCEFFPKDGIEVLRSLSLVKIGQEKDIQMHDLLRDLGRDIVRQENKDNPGKRSRLWYHKDAQETLKNGTGTETVETLRVRLSRSFGHHSPKKEFKGVFPSKAFRKLPNLRYLQIDHAKLGGDFKDLVLNLRWFRWRFCPQNIMFSNFRPKKLLILDLPNSKFTDEWEGWTQIKVARLKVLDLRNSHELKRTPNFSKFRNLEILNLAGCHNLEEIDSSIMFLKRLIFLDIRFCKSLKKLPLEFFVLETLKEFRVDKACIREISEIKGFETLNNNHCRSSALVSPTVALRRLSLNGYRSLTKLAETMWNMESLVELDLGGTGIRELPEAIGNLRNLVRLKVCNTHINKLPKAIGMLHKLEEFDTSDCYFLQGELLGDRSRLSSLRILKLLVPDTYGISRLATLGLRYSSSREVQVIPSLKLPPSLVDLEIVGSTALDCVSSLLNIKRLKCVYFEPLNDPPDVLSKLLKLEKLILSGVSLTNLPSLPSSLLELKLSFCRTSEGLFDMSNLKSLSKLELSNCSSIIQVMHLGDLESLISLHISECRKLSKLDGLQHLSLLQFVVIRGCEQLDALPDLSSLKNVNTLRVMRCPMLTVIQGLEGLESLTMMEVTRCMSLKALSDLSSCRMMFKLNLTGNENLEEVEGLEAITSLKHLDLSSCSSLRMLSDLSKLPRLDYLSIENCKKLAGIKGPKEIGRFIQKMGFEFNNLTKSRDGYLDALQQVYM